MLIEDLETGNEDTSTVVETESAPTAEEQHAAHVAAVSDAIDSVSEKPAESSESDATGEEKSDDEKAAEAAAEAAKASAQTPEEKAAADKVAADKAAAGKVKEPDAVNDPIPKDLAPTTQARMKSLVTKVKEATTTIEKVTAERDEIMGYITATKATPEQYSVLLDYMTKVNSGDPVQIKAAIPVLQAELRALAAMIGESVPGVDLLSEHEDLKDAVTTGAISQQHAEELAAARTQRATRDAQSQQVSAQTQAQQQAERVLNDGKASLNAVEAELRADPHYAAKRAILIPMLQPIFAEMPPSKWAAAWKAAYERLPAPSATITPIPQKAAGQPLRPGQPAGASAKAPTTAAEAVNFGIEQASRR